MEFVIKQSDLVRELQTVTGVVEKRATLPILANLLIEAGPSGLSVGASGSGSDDPRHGESDGRQAGKRHAPGGKLYEIARSLPDSDVQFKLLERQVVSISCERTRYKIARPTPGRVPEVPGPRRHPRDRASGGRAEGHDRARRVRDHHRRPAILAPRGAASHPGLEHDPRGDRRLPSLLRVAEGLVGQGSRGRPRDRASQSARRGREAGRRGRRRFDRDVRSQRQPCVLHRRRAHADDNRSGRGLPEVRRGHAQEVRDRDRSRTSTSSPMRSSASRSSRAIGSGGRCASTSRAGAWSFRARPSWARPTRS